MLPRSEWSGSCFVSKDHLSIETVSHGKLHKYTCAVTTQAIERHPVGLKPNAS